MYKEFRDTTLNGAVEQMYNEMAFRHRVRFPCIQIIKRAIIPAKFCKREHQAVPRGHQVSTGVQKVRTSYQEAENHIQGIKAQLVQVNLIIDCRAVFVAQY